MTVTDRSTWTPFAPRSTTPEATATPVDPSKSEVVAPVSSPVTAANSGTTDGDDSGAKTESPLATRHCSPEPEKTEPPGHAGRGRQESRHSPPENDSGSGDFADGGDTTATDDSDDLDEPVALVRPSFAQLLSPPLAEIFSTGQVTLPELIAYADTAPFAAKTGPARVAAVAFNRGIAVPGTATAYLAAWALFRHPARAAFFAGLGGGVAASAAVLGLNLTLLGLVAFLGWWGSIAAAATVIANADGNDADR